MKIFRSTAIFVIVYLIGMVPTYILPYFGSNSLFVGVLAAAAGFGFSPQTWAHLWCLAFLIAIAWARGPFAGRNYLPIFPVLATVFDMVPVVNMVPLVPTVMHILAIVLGTIIKPAADEEHCLAVCKKALYLLLTATVIAVIGTILFVVTMGQRVASLPHPAKPGDVFPAPSSASAATSSAVFSGAAKARSGVSSPAASSQAVSSSAPAEPVAATAASVPAGSPAATATPQHSRQTRKPAETAARKPAHVDHSQTSADKKQLQKNNEMLDNLLKD